jgi:aminopeptidase N
MYLEDIVGSSAFEDFAKKYIDTFKYKAVTSEDFKNSFLHFFNTDQFNKSVKITAR